MCKYFQQNRCHFGPRCRYSHDINTFKTTIPIVENMISTFTTVRDCDTIICYHLDKSSLNALGCVDRYCDQLITWLMNDQPFWKKQLECRYQLFDIDRKRLFDNNNDVKEYKNMALYFDHPTQSFEQQCDDVKRL